MLVIGLDSADPTLLEKWSAEGYCPAIAALQKSGLSYPLENKIDTLPGTIWLELSNGRSGHKSSVFCTVNQVRSGEAHYRQITASEIDPEQYFWSVASRAGKRVAVMDPIEGVRNPAIDALQVLEWGSHDRFFGTKSHPEAEISNIKKRFQGYPVSNCDRYPRNNHGFERLLEDLLAGIEQKTSIFLDYIQREHWDLFACAFSETHCSGHQLWHFHDPSHRDHKEIAPTRLKNGLRSVYQKIDVAIGKLAAAVGTNANVIVVASHGMGAYVGGYQLIPEILTRLGMSSDRGLAKRSMLRQLQNQIKPHVPMDWVPALERLGRSGLFQSLQGSFGGLVFPLQSANTRAAFVPNNRIGAIRLNIKGREPMGCLEPGAEVNAVLAELRERFLELKHVPTGESIAESVRTTDEVFTRDRHPNLPDLIINWRTDIGPIETCRSERVGEIHVPIAKSGYNRSGDHTPASRLWASGPAVKRYTHIERANVLDLPPTVLNLLEVPLPNWFDGHPLRLRT